MKMIFMQANQSLFQQVAHQNIRKIYLDIDDIGNSERLCKNVRICSGPPVIL